MHRFDLPIASLDAMLAMKATLVADGVRTGLGRRVVDTADAVMLGGAASAVAVVRDFLAALDEQH